MKAHTMSFGFRFDGKNAHQIVLDDLADIDSVGDSSPAAFSWIHLHKEEQHTAESLKQLEIDRVVIDALLAEETRPRCSVYADGVLLNLRGVNLNPGAEPEDMISIRLWIEAHRVISVWVRPLFAVQDVVRGIERGQMPHSPGDLVAKLALRLADRVEPTVASLNEQVDHLEELSLDTALSVSSRKLAEIRRTSIQLRRYLFPQRDALTTLAIEDMSWLLQNDQSRISEAAERITRLCEELDSIRDRTQIVHDQIVATRAETMNRQMFILSVVAAIFLPLGLLTGLLGINVGGIPGTETAWAFTAVCIALVVLGAALVWVFKKMGLFG